MTKQNFACPHPGCCYVSDQESVEIHQVRNHLDPLHFLQNARTHVLYDMPDGWREACDILNIAIDHIIGAYVPEPSMDDGWTDEEIWGEKQVSCGVETVSEDQRGSEVTWAHRISALQPKLSGPAGIHTGTTLDALGDSVSRAFQNARPGPLQRIACTEAAKELDERAAQIDWRDEEGITDAPAERELWRNR